MWTEQRELRLVSSALERDLEGAQDTSPVEDLGYLLGQVGTGAWMQGT